ncbi:MAG: hypothetical protein U5L96_16260 [Owenweeksia sp.]|nr:hypothetical protein [Owenweeksia sp.]
MKQLLYILFLVHIACGEPKNQDKDNSAVDDAEFIKTTKQNTDTVSLIDKEINLDTLKNLEVFKDFAVNYTPTRKPNSGVAILPAIPDSVLQAMNTLKLSHPEEFEKYLTLIFIKLYSAHLECCHQSYEVRRQPPGRLDKEKDPLVYEFNNLINKYSYDKPIEFISSSISYDYVKSHKYLLDFEPIKKHVDKIEHVQKKIEEGL